MPKEMLKPSNPQNKKVEDLPKEETKYRYVGNTFNCPDCRELRGVIDGKEYTKNEFIRVTDKYKEEGVSLLSVCVEDRLCEKCSSKKYKEALAGINCPS